jgi:hypothetical protein
MDGVGPWLTLAALIIAAASLGINALGLRQKTEQSYTDQLEERIEKLEKRMRECEGARERLLEENARTAAVNIKLATENAELMRELLAAKRNAK